MRLMTFLLLILSAGSQCNSQKCAEETKASCNDMPYPTEIPENKEELDKACSAIIQYGNCHVDVMECEDREDRSKILNRMKDVLDYIGNVCNPDNDIYKVVLRNLECMKSSTDSVHAACELFRISDARKALVRSYMERLNADYNNAETNSQRTQGDFETCLHSLWETTCRAITVGERCGEETRDVLLDIDINIDYNIYGSCTGAEIELIPEFVQAYETADEDTQEDETGNKK